MNILFAFSSYLLMFLCVNRHLHVSFTANFMYISEILFLGVLFVHDFKSRSSYKLYHFEWFTL